MTGIFSTNRGNGRPRFVSHRGFRPLAPDNSLPGFAYAGRLRQWAIETDVHATRDGTLVCCHDATVDAMYDGQGPIREMTWSEVSRLRLHSGARVECFSGDELRMPLFSEYLSVCKAYGAVPFIELKTPEADRVMRDVREAGFGEEDVIMSSFHLEWLEQARASAPGLFLHHIFSNDEGMERLATLGNAGVSWRVDDPSNLSDGAVQSAHDRGLKVCLRAADSHAAVAQMQSIGLDYIPTNTMDGVINV